MGKKKKSVRILEAGDNEAHDQDDGLNFYGNKNQHTPNTNFKSGSTNSQSPEVMSKSKPKFGDKSRSRSRSVNKKASVKQNQPIFYTDAREQIYEAKYEKYLANKQQKEQYEKRMKSMQKEDFDITTKNPSSPSKYARKYTNSDKKQNLSGIYDPDELVSPDYENQLLVQEQQKRLNQRPKGDPFKMLGVSQEEKMSFFLLKWVFNAIKRESDKEDPFLKGKPYVTKNELVKQLAKN